MEQTTIESRVASAILERNVGNIEIEGVTYEIAPPSIATLIVVSEFIASLPIVEKVEKTEIVNSVLHHARFFRPLGDIAATLILGAKSLTEERVVVQEKRYLFGLIKRKSKKKIKIDKRAELAKAILENVRFCSTSSYNGFKTWRSAVFSPLPLPCQRRISSNRQRKW